MDYVVPHQPYYGETYEA